MGGGRRPPPRPPPPPPLRDSTPCRPKGSPLCTILRYPYLVTDPKNFLKAPLAPIYTYFRGERVPKKRNFFGQNFLKSAKNAFLACFSKFCLRRTGSFYCFGRARKINSGRPKKKSSTKIFENPERFWLPKWCRVKFREQSSSPKKRSLEYGKIMQTDYA